MLMDVGDGDLSDITAAGYETAIRLERLRVREALNARDVAVGRLAEACASVREKADALNALQQEKEQLQKQLDGAKRAIKDESEKENQDLAASDEKTNTVTEVRKLTDSMKIVDNRLASLKVSEHAGSSVRAELENSLKNVNHTPEPTMSKATKVLNDSSPGSRILRDVSNAHTPVSFSSPFSPSTIATPRDSDAPDSPWTPLEGERAVALPSVSTSERIGARYAVLASLPLPSGIPDDSLTPVLIPAPYTLHDFIGTTSGLLRSQLGNYRVFQQSTTTWCPEREEHGYYLTPIFKCSTNPRVNTAHRWSMVDITSKLDKPTECFYNKDGKWYYAGIYKSLRLDDLCTQEWECLSLETSQALIKDTLVARKNTSPQNIYETGQLYSIGALRVACIGLQCIGFNNTLYRALLEHAALCTQTGKWRASPGGFGNGLGIGSGSAWNCSASAPASNPGSPVAPGGGAQASGITAGGRFMATAPAPPPLTPTVKILQHTTPDLAAAPGGRILGNT